MDLELSRATLPAIGNSDGIDVSCEGFVIQNSLVQNGDDSICMKSQNHGSTVGSARNGLIRNCTEDLHDTSPYFAQLSA